MPLTVTSICERTLRESGFPTQSAYVGTQAGDLINRAAQEIAQLPLSRPTKSYSVTIASQAVFPADSLTSAGALATFTTETAHGYTTGDLVRISGASPAAYNGDFPITVTGATTFTYTMASSPGVGAGGSPTCTHLAHGLPSDFRQYVPETAYIVGNAQRVYWPTDPSDWAVLKAGFIDPGALLVVRIIGGYLYLHEPPTGEVLTFEYQSNALFSDTTGFTFKQRITADTDVWLLDDDLLMMNFKWRWKKEKGIDDWQVDAAEWQTYVRNYMGETRGARALIFGRPTEHGAVEPYTNLWRP
jgi:hypothetical protein